MAKFFSISKKNGPITGPSIKKISIPAWFCLCVLICKIWLIYKQYCCNRESIYAIKDIVKLTKFSLHLVVTFVLIQTFRIT